MSLELSFYLSNFPLSPGLSFCTQWNLEQIFSDAKPEPLFVYGTIDT